MNNMLLNQDVREVFKTIPDNSIDLVVTDPPYKTTSRGNAGTSGGMLQKEINKKGQVFKHNNIKPQEYIPELYRVLKDGSHCYIMTNHVNLQEMLNVATESGFKFVKCLIWDKGNKIMGQYYMSSFEYILFLRKGKAKRINNCGTADILRVPNIKLKGEDGKNLHDTEKPVELMKIMIDNSSNEGDIVFDPFGGIGSTAIACVELNRKCISVEIDKEYYDIKVDRVKEYINRIKVK